jgi:DeoR family transcriptional regulator, aga operon transcriptional repressor
VQRRQRRGQIVSVVVERGRVDVPSLARQFAVSPATIRRDLEALQEQRLVCRTHGGATVHAAFNDLPLSYKKTKDLQEKQRIARHAAAFLDGAQVIGTTGGTTVSQFAALLRGRDDLTVVTNALNIAADLVGRPGPRVLIAGGEVRVSSQESVGPSAEAFLAGCSIDVAFLGVDGVDAVAGCTNYDLEGARVNAALARRARKRIVLADATKIGRVALAQVCRLAEVDILITDRRVARAQLEPLRRQGCTVVCV